MPGEATAASAGYYFPVSPLLLFPQSRGDFGVYLRLSDRYMLWAHPDEPFSAQNLKNLSANGVEEVYVLTAHREQFEAYLERNLGQVLSDDATPMAARAKVFYNASVGLVKEVFHNRLPASLGVEQHQKLLRFATLGVRFLLREDSIKSLASLISHHYQTYSHCVHVFVYATAMLGRLGLDEETMVQTGLGALLHDIGKTKITRKILDKPGKLTESERAQVQAHPVLGAGLCAQVPLSHAALNGILFHHERVDGGGYPAGLSGPDIPLPVKVLAVADVYDALVSKRAYAPARAAFDALSVMRQELDKHLDPEAYRELVLVLSGAEIV
ncbi:MAG: HD domain-containing protein [Desulfarculus sp.]|nr:HD domain-containing protein [Desulfarculus sp.]